MFRRLLCVSVLFLLCGCSAVKNPDSLAASVKEGYAASPQIEADVLVQENTEDAMSSYQLHVVYFNTETPHAQITVQAPESIAGLTVDYEGQSGTLAYQDTVLETLLPERSGLTPVDAVPALIQCLISCDPSSLWMEDDCLILQYQEKTEECTALREISLNTENGAMQSARIYCNGSQILSCSCSSFTIQ